jgi:hypothetical protein
MNTTLLVPFTLALSLLTACAGDASTRIRVTVEAPLELDQLELELQERSTLVDRQPVLEIIVPDAMAGQPAELRVWGVVDGEQVAYGKIGVVAKLHDHVDVTIALVARTCAAAACARNALTCDGDAITTCEVAADGCLVWSPATACPSDAPFCSNGRCAVDCADECDVGGRECSSAEARRECGEFDTDACRDWGPAIACGATAVCSDGACDSPSCPEGDACDDDDPCTMDDRCAEGTCAGEPLCPTPANAEVTCDGGCGFVCRPGFQRVNDLCLDGKLVFATSTKSTGNLGGVTGADQKCQSLATAAGLPGTYLAWISTPTTSPLDRFVQSAKPYRLVDGTKFANDFAGLVSVTAAPRLTELGTLVSSQFAWTATTSAGAYTSGTTFASCSNWTAANGIRAVAGKPTSRTFWSDDSLVECDQTHAHYCFQQ